MKLKRCRKARSTQLREHLVQKFERKKRKQEDETNERGSGDWLRREKDRRQKKLLMSSTQDSLLLADVCWCSPVFGNHACFSVFSSSCFASAAFFAVGANDAPFFGWSHTSETDASRSICCAWCWHLFQQSFPYLSRIFPCPILVLALAKTLLSSAVDDASRSFLGIPSAFPRQAVPASRLVQSWPVRHLRCWIARLRQMLQLRYFSMVIALCVVLLLGVVALAVGLIK